MLTETEIENIFSYFTKFDRNYKKFRGSKKDYINFIVKIVNNSKKPKTKKSDEKRIETGGMKKAGPPTASYSLIRSTITKLNQMAEHKTLKEARRILPDLVSSDASKELVDAYIIAAGTQGESYVRGRVLPELRKGTDTIFDNITPVERIGDIDPVLDFKVNRKDNDKITFIEVKSKKAGSISVDVQFTKFVAALYLNSGLNKGRGVKSFNDELPIILLTRGDIKDKSPVDRAGMFDLAKVLADNNIKLDEKKFNNKDFNIDGGRVDMNPVSAEKWRAAGLQAMEALKRKGYGSIEGNSFRFPTLSESKLKITPIYEGAYIKPVVKSESDSDSEVLGPIIHPALMRDAIAKGILDEEIAHEKIEAHNMGISYPDFLRGKEKKIALENKAKEAERVSLAREKAAKDKVLKSESLKKKSAKELKEDLEIERLAREAEAFRLANPDAAPKPKPKKKKAVSVKPVEEVDPDAEYSHYFDKNMIGSLYDGLIAKLNLFDIPRISNAMSDDRNETKGGLEIFRDLESRKIPKKLEKYKDLNIQYNTLMEKKFIESSPEWRAEYLRRTMERFGDSEELADSLRKLSDREEDFREHYGRVYTENFMQNIKGLLGSEEPQYYDIISFLGMFDPRLYS